MRNLIARKTCIFLLSLGLFGGDYVSFASTNSLSAKALAAGESKFNTDHADLYLFGLWLSKHQLTDSLVGYQVDNRLYVSAESFFSAVEFPITKSIASEEKWEGWYLREANKFNLNIAAREVQISGNRRALKSDDFLITEEDGLLINTEALRSWFDLQFIINTHNQTIMMSASYLLPFQERNNRLNQLNKKQNVKAQPIWLNDQYHMLTVPQADLTTYVSHQSQAEKTYDTASENITSSFDLLKHSAFYTGTFNQTSRQGRAQAQRFTLTREGLTDVDQLFLGARSYSVGDVFLTESNLVTKGGSGAGVVIQRNSNNNNQIGNKVTIQGDATPGWQVELYRNNELLELGVVDSSGRYIFENQETMAGENQFLIKLYGPAGQVVDKTNVIWGGGYNLKKNDFRYNISSLDYSKEFLTGDVDNIAAITSKHIDQATFSYALTDDFELGTGFHRVELYDQTQKTFSDKNYTSINARYNTPLGVFWGEGTKKTDGGSAAALQFLTSFYNQSVSVTHQKFNNFISDYTNTTGSYTQLTGVNLLGSLPWKNLTSYNFSVANKQFVNGDEQIQTRGRLTGKLGPLYLSNELSYIGDEKGSDSFNGQLKISGRYNTMSFSGGLLYDVNNNYAVKQIDGSLRWQATPKIFNTLTFSKQLQNDQESLLRNQLTWQQKIMDLTFTAEVDSKKNWLVALGANFSLGYDTDHFQPYLTRNRLSRTGRPSLDFFVDSNDNGIKDSDEEYVEEASWQRKNSLISAGNIPASSTFSIRAKDFKIDSPLLVAKDEYLLRTHPGSSLKLDIPLTAVGDIEGNIASIIKHSRPDKSKIEITLLDKEGKFLATTNVEFDGYYRFNKIPVGRYKLIATQRKPFFEEYQIPLVVDAENGYWQVDTLLF